MPKINARIQLPGDKSISHRSALFSALRDGESRFKNFNFNQDCTATLSCLKELGVFWEFRNNTLIINGKHPFYWEQPAAILNAQNSGTTARLLSGILAALPIETRLTGDTSLQKRPMARILDPLQEMGADIDSANRFLPLHFKSGKALHGIRYKLPVASAQVKSAILLAGLFSGGQTEVVETIPSRDHTERMLNLLKQDNPDGTVSIFSHKQHEIPDISMTIPGDISSAAFFMAGALALPGSELLLEHVSLNPTRDGILRVFKAMGAEIETEETVTFPEPAGTIRVRSSHLVNRVIPREWIANIIDEIPILAVLATRAEGRFSIRNAKELRFKESDRIAMMVKNLQTIGVDVKEFEDGFEFDGPVQLAGGTVQTAGDHRIAMAFAIADLFTTESIRLDDPACVAVSFPDFWDILKQIIT